MAQHKKGQLAENGTHQSAGHAVSKTNRGRGVLHMLSHSAKAQLGAGLHARDGRIACHACLHTTAAMTTEEAKRHCEQCYPSGGNIYWLKAPRNETTSISPYLWWLALWHLHIPQTISTPYVTRLHCSTHTHSSPQPTAATITAAKETSPAARTCGSWPSGTATSLHTISTASKTRLHFSKHNHKPLFHSPQQY